MTTRPGLRPTVGQTVRLVLTWLGVTVPIWLALVLWLRGW